MLGLPLSTLLTGFLFVALLTMWRQPATPTLAAADT
jgi:hypothetical protein